MASNSPTPSRVKFVLSWSLLLLVVGWSLSTQINTTTGPSSPPPSASSTAVSSSFPERSNESVSPYKQNPEIPVNVLKVLETIGKRNGEPPPGYVGGRTFQNRERRLPHGRYREYDVHPRIRGRNRGAERLVIEQHTGKAYYTEDHYNTFIPIHRGQP